MSYRSLVHAALETAKISFPTVVDAAFRRVDPAECDARLASWARAIVDEARIEIVSSGIAPPRRSVLLLSNHESLFDIPVLFCAFPHPLRMVAKRELFAIPVWGRAMLEAGFIPVDRKRGSDARRLLREAGARLKASGRSLWMAPEGTRGDGRGLLPFKSGAFDLAKELELPILPVSLDGTAEVLGKGAKKVQRGREVRVRFHSILEPPDFPPSRDELRTLVRNVVASAT